MGRIDGLVHALVREAPVHVELRRVPHAALLRWRVSNVVELSGESLVRVFLFVQDLVYAISIFSDLSMLFSDPR